ncbi:asparagine synthase (glutamine-hydrolyzing) [Desulfovibrio subterraneus]|uniref:asparagine synthase (glutamine-hydrolyzing) n=1 Tax=Desulfovibrio subterraneus TaxID=2718620 RepID=A0A7J0BH70_9BACT|nr:asparagine synthase (glutamine-hydrolyzing) [Desulfovibrio subterraneus]GFM32541.1 hypothetical protein DSM101010T_09060 [Desulfovibrio subterraneus]
MCGIAGYWGDRRIADDRAAAALACLRHRGPDGCGEFRHERGGRHVLLLHTRLSIIDLDERSAQPMRYGNHVLAFNGELYNYLELRRNMQAEGVVFGTDSDTEVLLRSLARCGVDSADVLPVLDGMEGMWAFAMYDMQHGTLALCRDRFGEKPLFLYRCDHGVYFASEVKALFALLGRRLPVNRTKILRYLVNGYKSIYKSTDTFFEGVEELPNACWLRLDEACSPVRYWTPRIEPDEAMTYEEAVSGARAHLLKAVELRLRSDVPLAFCMSGGVDSNALISIARREFGYRVHGFTVVNSDGRYNEWESVARSVRELGLEHTPVPVGGHDFLGRLTRMVGEHDAPVCTISYFAHHLLMEQLAAAGFKVSISGTGADELFSGYYDHYLMYLAAVHGTPQYGQALDDWSTHVLPVVMNPLYRNPRLFVDSPAMRDHVFADACEAESRMAVPFHEAFAEENFHGELLRNRMMNELFREVVPAILREDDHNAMAFSVENRSPFLDRALLEFCLRIPTRHLMRNGYNKAVLRDAVRGIAPDCVLDARRKVGFNGSLAEFLDLGDESVRRSLLADSPVFSLVDRKAFGDMLGSGRLSGNDSKFLFGVLSTKFFLEEFGTDV